MIAQGIQKGIELYKKQQNAKIREIDKKRKQASKQQSKEPSPEATTPQTAHATQTKQHWLPWALLLLSWIGFAAYLTL